MSAETLTPHDISADELHVWYVQLDRVNDAALSAYQALLLPSEIARGRQFRFEKDRRLFAVARALLRTGLSRYADVAARSWIFRKSRYGKPEIAAPKINPRLRFNISHTDGMAALAVTLGQEVGVDVENIGRTVEAVELAARYFAPCEAAELRTWSPEQRNSRFFDYWTLKEAYLKARGMGLSISTRSFSMRLEGQAARIEFVDEPNEAASAWQLAHFRPTDQHKLAVAVWRGSRDKLQIVCGETIP